MGWTIGDVFAVVATIFGVFLTLWATIVAVALLFPQATERARVATSEPKRLAWKGILMLALLIFGVVLVAAGFPIAKLAGWVMVLGSLTVAATGAAGIARAAGKRIESLDPAMPAYPAMVRGAAFVVAATNLPVLGWFAFAPILLIASLGAGCEAILSPRSQAVEVV